MVCRDSLTSTHPSGNKINILGEIHICGCSPGQSTRGVGNIIIV